MLTMHKCEITVTDNIMEEIRQIVAADNLTIEEAISMLIEIGANFTTTATKVNLGDAIVYTAPNVIYYRNNAKEVNGCKK